MVTRACTWGQVIDVFAVLRSGSGAREIWKDRDEGVPQVEIKKGHGAREQMPHNLTWHSSAEQLALTSSLPPCRTVSLGIAYAP